MTIKPQAWFVCLVALVGVVVSIALLPPAEHEAPAVVSTQAGALGDSTPAARTVTAAAAPTVKRSLDSAAVDGRVAVEATAVTAGPVLRVFEAESGRPLPGAEVFVADSQRADSQGNKPGGPWWEWLVQSVVPLRTDERGKVTLPPTTGRLRVVARSEGLFGASTMRPNGQEMQLGLDPDHEIAVRVADASGGPVAGVRVVLCADQGKKLRHRRELITDGSGSAHFEHVQLFRLAVDRKSKGVGSVVRGHADFVVLAAVPMFEPVMARLAAAAMPAVPVELRLGAAGKLDVRVCAPDGSVLSTPCQVGLTPVAASMAPSSSPWSETVRKLLALRGQKPLDAPGVRFETVGAGLIFDASVTFPGGRWNFVHKGLAGPAAGDARELVLKMPAKFAVLSGRLLDFEGRPATGMQVSMQVNGSRGPVETRSVPTTAAGRFEFAVKATQSAGYTLDVRRAVGGQPQGVLVTLPNLVPGQRRDLGDLRLAPLPVLALGTVRDDRGDPVSGATVALQSFRLSVGRRGPWASEAIAAQAKTDKGGHYQLFAEKRPLRVRLQARAKGHLTAESHDVEFGARVDLRLERLGSVVFSGLLPPWLPRRTMSYKLSRDGKKVREMPFSARRGGRFEVRLNSLASGAYDVAFKVRGLPRPLVEFGSVVVVPGAETTDPRLTDLDLSRALFRYVVRAAGSDGDRVRAPRAPLLVRLLEPSGQPLDVGFPWRSGQVEFYLPVPAVDVVALSRGHRPLRTRIQAGESQLTLAASAPVELHLPGLGQLAGPGVRVRVSMVLDGDPGIPLARIKTIDQRRGARRTYSSSSMGKSSVHWLGDTDRARFSLMHDGIYQVAVSFYRAGERRAVSLPLGTVSVTRTGPRALVLELTPSPEAVRSALSR